MCEVDYHKSWVEGLSKEDAMIELENRIYEATGLFEYLEHAGKVFGNGHHMRQQAQNAVRRIVKEHWNEKIQS
jgi:hypothetical protein